ncbi:MAG: hypothetical protein E6Q25_06785 [Acinetobacter sp.]|jgi:hypothetical protein|nr:MAG: hypothetical protein E6Q25_06785 [Acinetobacter sp.]
MQQTAVHDSTQDLSQEQIQRLIATSTGFIEAYVIPVYDDVAILLPQNVVLSAMNVPANVNEVEWHDKHLPTYIVHRPELRDVTALVIEGEDEASRFALLCDDMPAAMRLRISGVLDLDKATPERVYQYVNVDGQEYQIPHLRNIQKHLAAAK